MMMNIIMAACMYPILVIMWIVCLKYGKIDKKYVFGVTLTEEQKNSDQVKLISKTFTKESWICFAAGMWEPFLAFATDKVSIQFTIWIMWFLIILVVIFIPYARANVKTLAYKKANTPQENNRDDEALEYAELKGVRTIKETELLYPIMLSFIPPVYLLIASKKMNLDSLVRDDYWMNGWILVILALCTLLFVGLALWMDKGRTMVINGDSRINTNYSRGKKKLWKKLWLEISYLNSAVIIMCALSTILKFHYLITFIIMMTVETVGGIYLTVRVFHKMRLLDLAYESKFEMIPKVEADENWKWGMFYYNRHDRNTIVEKRFGVGTTMNMATKAGVITTIIGVLALVWIPFFCGYMIMEDFTPTHILIEDDQLICKHLKDDYVINLEDIEKVELLTELPKERQKSNGLATDYMEKGKFRSQEEGYFTEFLVLTYDVYIKVTTEDQIYYINGYDQEETRGVYDALTE